MKRFTQVLRRSKSNHVSPRGSTAEQHRNLWLESLEARQVLSGIGSCSIDFDPLSQMVAIWGSQSNDTATVTIKSGQVDVAFTCGSTSLSKRFAAASHIEFWGGDGTNKFTNKTTIPSSAYGGTGADTFYGGSASDYLWGGPGADVLKGYAGDDELEGAEGNDKLYGGAGDDNLYGGAGKDYVYGEDGNDYLDGGWTAESDYLYGHAGNDRLYGGPGGDRLYGGSGNDKLFGGDGYDYLYGEVGSDFLDDGSGTEYNNKGSDTDVDYNAYVWAIGGATYTDAYQGSSATCWLVSAISSVAQSGVDLANRISYFGDGLYGVTLYNSPSGYYDPANGGWTTVYVAFDGTTTTADAQPNPNQEGESWVIITQRAYLQVRGLSLTSPPSGWGEGPLTAFTGRLSTTYDRSGAQFVGQDFSNIWQALNNGRAVVADTADSQSALTTTTLIPFHQYTVVRIDATAAGWVVVLRNPWGIDGGSTASGNANDGEVQVNWTDFSRSMDAYLIA